MRMSRAAGLALVSAVLVAVIAAGTAGAGTPLPGKQHYMSFGPFCVSKSTGVMRAPQHTQPCHTGEVRIRHIRIPLSGPAGPSGVQGPKGATGPKGVQGAKGDKGDTGAQGIQGIQGAKGDTGLAGSNGVSVTHTTASSELCPTGGFVFHDSAGDALVCNGLMGPQGPKGDKGDTGPQGPQGLQGVPGTAGANGVSVTHTTATTEACPTGGFVFHDATGAAVVCNGLVGAQGPKGDTGAKGDTGPQGPQGPQGLIGPQGPKGDTGPQGPAGASGASVITVSGGAASGDKQFTVSCPANYSAISGGFDIQGSVTASYRSSPTGSAAGTTAWTIIQSSGASLSGTVYVYCLANS